VILGDHPGDRPRDPAMADHPADQATLDELFRAALERRPGATALVDPPDRAGFTDGAPRRITYAEADRMISAIAGRLQGFGLPADAIVALQLPNTVESALTLLGVLRAGLIAAPLPLLWRQSETAGALGRIGARALISCRRVGTTDLGEVAMHVAAETFAIRFVCGFGDDLPDGVIPLDDVFDAATTDAPAPVRRSGHPAHHVAVVTFDVVGDGIVPVARTHAELVAAGRAVVLGAGIAHDTVLLGALVTASFAGLASTVVPWLMVGGTLALHQPFTPEAFAEQRAAERCELAILPGPLAPRLLDAGLIDRRHGLRGVLAVWRAPDRLAASPAWPADAPTLVDLPVFGEIGLLPLRRNADGRPLPLPAGRIGVPYGAPRARAALDLERGLAGTLRLRGPMVPHHPFPPGIDRTDPLRLRLGDDGFVDTGFACRLDSEKLAMSIERAPAGIVSVGGYRFPMRDLQGMVAQIDPNGSVAALPDTLAGHRLAGVGPGSIAAELKVQGANPLLVAAFPGRPRLGRASAA
jgi:hypothetical protein